MLQDPNDPWRGMTQPHSINCNNEHGWDKPCSETLKKDKKANKNSTDESEEQPRSTDAQQTDD